MGRASAVSIVICASFVFCPVVKADVEVCENCRVKTIQQAISEANPGDTVFVGHGVYKEHDIIIDKSLKLTATTTQQRPVLDIDGGGSGIIIKADNVEVNGFLIKKSGFSYTDEMAGIKVLKSSHCLINNNKLEENSFGIYLAEVKGCLIANNQIRGTLKSESLSGNGIHVWNGEGIIIENNELVGNRDGIYFEFVKKSLIRKNKSIGNLRYGLHFMYSHDNEYRENLFYDNECGVAVMYSHGVLMFRNRFEHSHGPSSYGILLKDISDSSVGANIFLDNTIGIFADGTTRISFERNLFKNNGRALRILGDTDSNNFIQNDFVANTYDVSTNSTLNKNLFLNNYWSRYRGLDLNRDGFGEDPFRPVQFSSMLIENYPASVLLINSLFFAMLDQVEEAFPSLTPESYKDLNPKMTRVTDYD